MTLPPPLPPPLAANPYAAPQARLEEAPTEVLTLAGRGERLGAAILDSIILFAPAMVVVFAGLSMMRGSGGDSAVLFVLSAYLIPVALGFVNLYMLHNTGQTMAKRMLGIKIVRANGERCSTPRLVFARWLPMVLVGLIPLLSILVWLVDSLLIFAEDRRCIHDHIADTIVVKC